MRGCVCVYVCMYVRMYVHIYIYIYMCSLEDCDVMSELIVPFCWLGLEWQSLACALVSTQLYCVCILWKDLQFGIRSVRE